MASKRNECFDFLKGIACIAVVFMHCEFPGMFGTIVQCLMRWCVPMFFAVSGYFFRRETTEDCIRKARHILSITIWAFLFYAAFSVVKCLCIGGIDELSRYSRKEFTPFNIASFAVFNSPVFVNGHLWFLFALIYVYITCMILIRLGLFKGKKLYCCGLLICHFLISYGFYLIGKPLPGGAYRNFLFEGLPFFLLGNLFYHYTQTASSEKSDKAKKAALPVVFLGLVMSAAERLIIGRDFSVHISSVIVLLGLLFWAESDKLPSWGKKISSLGREDSLIVYIVHPAFFMTADAAASLAGFGQAEVWLWLRPLVTVVFTLLIAVSFRKIKNSFASA